MSKEEIHRLLKKYMKGYLSTEEKMRVEQWLEATRNDEPSSSFDTREQEELLAMIHDKIRAEEKVRIIPIRRYMQAAAIFLMTTLVVYYAWQKTTTPAVQFAEASTTTKKLLLVDGTIVWLKQNSSLSYPDKFTGNERHVILKGEALFEVAKDASHPFIVQCGDLTAKVLGTSFNIRISETQTELTVLTGKVNLSSQQDRAGIDILPNEKALYYPSLQKLSKVQALQNEVAEVAASTDYNMHFEETTMREIIKRIEGKFNVTVSLHEANINDCVITADFTDQSLETTLQKIANVFSFEYTIQKNIVTIRGGSCQ